MTDEAKEEIRQLIGQAQELSKSAYQHSERLRLDLNEVIEKLAGIETELKEVQ